jgi:hypothetical protein
MTQREFTATDVAVEQLAAGAFGDGPVQIYMRVRFVVGDSDDVYGFYMPIEKWHELVGRGIAAVNERW